LTAFAWAFFSDRVVSTGRRIFHTLDALRGIAAIGVVMFHDGPLFTPIDAPGGYLGVDLFFMMSGFVIARAYDERFRAGMDVREFMRIRLTRLCPLYLLGTMLGLLVAIVSFNGNNVDHWTGPTISLMAIFSIVMFPNITGFQNDLLFPFDIPCWSLFMEIAVNLAFGLLWKQLTTGRLIVVIACSALAVLYFLSAAGNMPDGGSAHKLAPGVVRTIFGFFVGVLIARQSGAIAPQKNTALFAAICLAFTVAVSSTPVHRVCWDAMCAMLVFPVIVYAAAEVDPPAWLRPAATFLGSISYAVYALHYPLLAAANAVFRARLAAMQSPLYLGCTLLAGLLFGCWLVDRYYDFPVRRVLSRAWRAKVAVVPSGAIGSRLATRLPQGG
jgi:peptidoglycan/LPS O-acetylase OafA/YrhL